MEGNALLPSAWLPHARPLHLVEGTYAPTPMENIVQLDSYRKTRKSAHVRRAPDAPRFFCLSCDSDQFKLYACGTVHCASCGALIRNVEVSDTQAK